VFNRGSIENLPDGCVEVECRVSRGGVERLPFGPLTAAVCSLDEIDRLFDEIWEAEKESLTAFS
jgi:alpha-galactosidase/6-phospho-beta-glucosidase family protein